MKATRALTVKQPWASAIIFAGKDVENRTWFNRHTVSTFAVHAGSGFDKKALESWPHAMPDDVLEKMLRMKHAAGAIIGVVTCIGVIYQSRAPRNPWFQGPIGWVLKDPVALKNPIPCGGSLGLWKLGPELERRLERELRRS